MGIDKLGMVRSIFGIRREQWLSPEKMKALQEKRLEEILESAKNTSYYRAILSGERIKGRGFSVLEGIPATEKDDVRMDPLSFVRPEGRSALATARTSGSSGKPLQIFMDDRALAYGGAVRYAMLTGMGLSPMDLLAQVNVWTNVPRLGFLGIFRHLHLPVMGPEADNLLQIRKHGANVVSAYPSVMDILSGLNMEGRSPLRLKSVFCGGETFSPRTRELIAASFSCEVFQTYGSMEFGFTAWECPEHSLHLCSSSVILEILDEKGRPKSGGEGEIAITTLYNRAMPLLRYRIGDMGSWGRECPCGRGWPVLKSISGRSSDSVTLPSGRRRPSFAFNVLYNTSHDISKIAQFQIVQESRGAFVFRYVPLRGGPGRPFLAEIEARIRKACLDEEVTVEFEERGSIPRPGSGKLSHIVPMR